MKRALPACLVTLLAYGFAAPAGAESKWTVTKGFSKRDNTPSVSMMLLPERGVVGMTALCLEGNVQVSVVPLKPPPLPPGAATFDLSYRIDGGAPQRRTFTVTGGGKDFTLAGAGAVAMLKDMSSGTAMVLSYELPTGAVEAADYTIAGTGEAIRPLRQTCQW